MSTFNPTGLLLFLIIIGLIGFLAFKVVKRLKEISNKKDLLSKQQVLFNKKIHNTSFYVLFLFV